MRNTLELKSISDDALLRRVPELLKNSRHVEAELIAHLAEVDLRRLYARTSSSLFTYSTQVLHMSEYEALLRMRVARASRKHPVLLEMLADGRLHLSGIDKLAPVLTLDNCEALLARAVHRSKRDIEELVAEVAPKPDVPPAIRKLPRPRAETKPEQEVLCPDQVDFSAPKPQQEKPEVSPSVVTTPQPAPSPAKPAEVKPLSPERFRVSFTASAGLRDKLERLKALMRSSVPDGDLAAILEEAVTEKLEKLEAKRYGTTKAPRKSLNETDTSASSRTIPAPVKRAVVERDKRRCVFKDSTGRRCDETQRLEFHHIKPYGRKGNHHPSNIELRCRTHNLYEAERDYGKSFMNKYRSRSGRVSEPAASYTFSHRATSAHPSP